MLASTPLIVRIAAEPAIGDFVERSKLRHVQLGRVKSTDEDVAMGFYMSRFHLGGLANVTYVRINDQLTNLGCARNGGLYGDPTARCGKHFVKTAGGHAYVWSIVVDGMAPNVTRCIQWTGGRLESASPLPSFLSASYALLFILAVHVLRIRIIVGYVNRRSWIRLLAGGVVYRVRRRVSRYSRIDT